MLCVASAYIGNPITCDHKNVPSLDVVHQYCWLHGSYSILEVSVLYDFPLFVVTDMAAK